MSPETTPTPGSPMLPPDFHWRYMMLLGVGLVFFTVVTIVAAAFFPQNAAMYALFSNVLGNFSGALFTKIKS